MKKNLLPIHQIIKQGWHIYSGNFKLFLLPILIMLLPALLFFVIIFYIKFIPLAYLLDFFLYVIMIIINLWINIILIKLINTLLKNNKTAKNIYFSAIASLPSYLLVVILSIAAIFGGFVLLIIPGIIISIYLAFAQYINILEIKHNTGLASLKSSLNLVKGRWWQTLARIALPFLAVYLIVSIIIWSLAVLLKFNPDNYFQQLIFDAVNSIVYIILTPLFICFQLIVYHNLKQTQINK